MASGRDDLASITELLTDWHRTFRAMDHDFEHPEDLGLRQARRALTFVERQGLVGWLRSNVTTAEPPTISQLREVLNLDPDYFAAVETLALTRAGASYSSAVYLGRTLHAGLVRVRSLVDRDLDLYPVQERKLVAAAVAQIDRSVAEWRNRPVLDYGDAPYEPSANRLVRGTIRTLVKPLSTVGAAMAVERVDAALQEYVPPDLHKIQACAITSDFVAKKAAWLALLPLGRRAAP